MWRLAIHRLWLAACFVIYIYDTSLLDFSLAAGMQHTFFRSFSIQARQTKDKKSTRNYFGVYPISNIVLLYNVKWPFLGFPVRESSPKYGEGRSGGSYPFHSRHCRLGRGIQRTVCRVYQVARNKLEPTIITYWMGWSTDDTSGTHNTPLWRANSPLSNFVSGGIAYAVSYISRVLDKLRIW